MAKFGKGDAPRGRNSRSQPQNWFASVTHNSDALDLEQVFSKDKPAEIAQSLKRSAEHSSRRKSTPFRSAMSLLTFYINRAGREFAEEPPQGAAAGQAIAQGLRA
jgi:hypothetical protein